MQGFAPQLTHRIRVPTGPNKYLFFSWHQLKISLYLLLTVNCPDSTQIGLTFHLTGRHHHGFSKGIAKSKSYRLITVCQHTCESFVLWHIWWEIQNWYTGLLINREHEEREVKWLAPHVKRGRLTMRTTLRACHFAKNELALCPSKYLSHLREEEPYKTKQDIF